MNARATIREIAGETGLSLATVSRALKQSTSVRRETAERVRLAAEKLGYRRNAAGAGLRTGRSDVVCLIMPLARPGDPIGDVGALNLIGGINERLASAGISLNVVPGTINRDPLESVMTVVRRGIADGVIITSTRPEDARVKALHAAGIPFVTFGRTELALPHAFYDIDEADFAYRATRLLIARGVRRPVLLSHPLDYQFAWHRRSGFIRALGEAGLSFDEAEAIIVRGLDADFAARIAGMAGGPCAPDGIIADGEVSALALLSALERVGRHVGTDIHLATLETSTLPDLFMRPVPGFFQDLGRAGWMLADFLLRRMAGEAPEQLRLIETVHFRPRDSIAGHPNLAHTIGSPP